MSVQVNVHGGNGEKAIRDLKRKMQRELVFRLMKMSRFYHVFYFHEVRRLLSYDYKLEMGLKE